MKYINEVSMQFPKVTRYTRAPRQGKYVICPHCEGAMRVFNFSFSALGCMYCKRMVDKYDLTCAPVLQ